MSQADWEPSLNTLHSLLQSLTAPDAVLAIVNGGVIFFERLGRRRRVLCHQAHDRASNSHSVAFIYYAHRKGGDVNFFSARQGVRTGPASKRLHRPRQ